jgi:hypothetical protein
MKRFVNYRKRGVELPKGCKNLADLLNAPKQSKQTGEVSPKTIRESECEYCGASARFRCGIWGADGTMFEEEHAWCGKCQEDLKDFKSRPENRLPDFPEDFDFSDPKAMEPVEQLMREIEERKKIFMRQRVAERKGPDNAS